MSTLPLSSGLSGSAKVEKLLNVAFGLEEDRSFFEDFPVWNDAGLIQRREILQKGIAHAGEIVSLALGRKATLHMGSTRHSVGVIGAVATHASHQGKGYATRLVGELCNEFFQAGCEFVALWGSHQAFYERLGFTQEGEQWLVPLEALALSEVDRVQQLGLTLRHDFSPPLFHAMKRVRLNGGLDLRDSDYTWMARHAGVTWAWLQNPLGGVSAYIGVGRGIDLPGIVHEWGGEPDALGSLLRWARDRVPDLKLLSQPRWLARSELLAYSPKLIEKTPVALIRRNPLAEQTLPSSQLWFWGLDGA